MRLERGEGSRRLTVGDVDASALVASVTDQVRRVEEAIAELRSAVIWVKGVSSYTPDYFVEMLPTSPWIHQPFEGYDSLSSNKLLEKWKV